MPTWNWWAFYALESSLINPNLRPSGICVPKVSEQFGLIYESISHFMIKITEADKIFSNGSPQKISIPLKSRIFLIKLFLNLYNARIRFRQGHVPISKEEVVLDSGTLITSAGNYIALWGTEWTWVWFDTLGVIFKEISMAIKFLYLQSLHIPLCPIVRHIVPVVIECSNSNYYSKVSI